MKIAIFGDSYAHEADNSTISWSHLLRAQYHHDIHNYARGATCLFWSYQQLVKHIDNFDTIVFVATQVGRDWPWPRPPGSTANPWLAEASMAFENSLQAA